MSKWDSDNLSAPHTKRWMGGEDGGETGWRDIASAPKDGTELIVSGWIFNNPAGGERWVTMAYWNEDEWFQSHDVGLYPPTHWQPLPEPPK